MESHVPDNMVVSDSMQKSTHGQIGPSIQPSTGGLNTKKLEPMGADRVSDSHTSQVATHCLLEEFGDNLFVNVGCDNSLQRVSNTQIEQNISDVKLLEIVGEISTQESQKVAHQSLKMQDGCVQRNFIQAHPTYLRTLSQSHSGWIFGAIAELVDNSRDANATR